MYYWILAFDGAQPILLGPCNTEAEARSKGYSELQSDFEIYPLKTRDSSAATQQLKNIILEKTRNLHQSLQKFSHQVKRG